ncbi:MAG: hypothetical protein AAFU64_01675, partial [Bacteroidota bacterium]
LSLVLSTSQSRDLSASRSVFLLEIPVAVSANFGLGATSSSRSSFGGYLGVGYAYNSYSATETGTFLAGTTESRLQGLYLHGGLRFRISKEPLGLSIYSILDNSEASLYGIRGAWYF